MAVGCGSGGDDTVSPPARRGDRVGRADDDRLGPPHGHGGGPAPRCRARARRQLRRAGLRHLAARATRTACSSSSRPARSAWCATGAALAAPFLDIRSLVTSGGEQGLLSMAFAPDYARSGLLLRLLHGPRRRTSGSSSTGAASAERGRPGLARGSCCGWPTPSPTTTAACCCSVPTACSTSARATAAAAATARRRAATPRTSARCSARSCASTRGASGGRPYTRPARQPVRRPRRRARRDLRLRPAQPVALLVRPPHAATSSIGDVGQDAVEEVDFARARARRAGRTSAGGRSRAARATRRASRRPGARRAR